MSSSSRIRGRWRPCGRFDDAGLDLAPEIAGAQFQRLVAWDRKQPGKTFSSPEAAAKYLNAEFGKKR
jgi:hypothetical protein